MNFNKLQMGGVKFLALMGATLLSANALADPEAPSLVDYDVNGDGTTTEGEQAYKLQSADDLYWFMEYVNNNAVFDENAEAYLTNVNAFLANNITVNNDLFLKLDEDGTVKSGEEVKEWFPIGYYNSDGDYVDYAGTFDGGGHTISGLYFNNENQGYVGLFGQIYGATIKNVGVIDSYFSGKSAVGGVCGYSWNGTITNCYNSGKVEGSNYIGGVCGYNEGTIENCYNSGEVSGGVNSRYIGGVCGSSTGTITNCYNTGKVSGSWNIGGVCGYNAGTITNCYYLASTDDGNGGKTADQFADGTVAQALRGGTNGNVWGQYIGIEEAPTLCGAIVNPTLIAEGEYAGYYAIGNADELYWFAKFVNKGGTNVNANAVLTANITVNENLLESLAFDENGNVTNGDNFKAWSPIGYNVEYDYYYYKGKFDGNGHTISGLFFDYHDTQYNMGLFGDIYGATIKNLGVIDSYFSCSDEWTLGGICGYNSGGTIENCFYAGELRGYTSVGGVCGQSTGTIEKCYNTSKVYGSDNYVGGVCGYNMGTITNCYNTGEVTGEVNDNKKVGGVCGRNRSGYTANCYNTGKVSGRGSRGVCGYYEGGTLTNCYFLSGTDANATLATAEQFANGTVAKALRNYDNDKEEANKIGSDIWGQTIGKDPSPVFSGKIVEASSTAIKAVEAESNKTIKTIKDGQIVIIRNGVMYDMQGRKL